MVREPIDILIVNYNRNYIAGDFYDDFEYFQFLIKYTNYKIKFIVVTDIPEYDIITCINEKYDVGRVSFDGFECVSYDSMKRDLFVRKIFKYIPKIIFSTSSFACINFLNTIRGSNLVVPYKHILVVHNGTYEMNKMSYGKFIGKRDVITFLGDSRTKDHYKDLYDIEYRKRIYFDLFRSIGESDDRALINLYPKHKNFKPDDIINIIKELDLKRVLLYCHHSVLGNYENMELAGVDIKLLLPPIKKFPESFNRYIYIPVDREWDISPRLIPESIWYGKKSEYINFGVIKDGSYYRQKDVDNDFNSLHLKEGDDIIGILGRYLDGR